MRFCPFCTQENTALAVSCAACGRRLPPLPQRRVRSASAAVPVTPAATTVVAPVAPVAVVPAPVVGPVVTPLAPLAPLAPVVADEQRALRTSLVPPPAALRRQAPPVEERPEGGDARRATDVVMEPSPAVVEPLPTRVARAPEMAERPFAPAQVMPVPKPPEPGLVNYGRYAVAFARARWQRRRAVKQLHAEIKGDTDALDVVLGTLGREARAGGIDNRVLASENQAITAAEQKKAEIATESAEVEQRKQEENARFEEVERERTIKLTEVERERDTAERELEVLDGQRRGLKDRRKEVERRQKAHLQAAEQHDTDAGNSPLGDVRSELRKAAEGRRAEVNALEPEKQDYERKLGELEPPLATAQSKALAVRSEVDLAKRSLADAREGHRHRLAELEAELGRKHRERDNTDGEIQRRLVTLGTLINLHRVEGPGFTELYQRVDRLRSAISSRTGEIDHLTAEREAYDRGSLMRGYAVLAGVVVGLITVVAILIAIL